MMHSRKIVPGFRPRSAFFDRLTSQNRKTGAARLRRRPLQLHEKRRKEGIAMNLLRLLEIDRSLIGPEAQRSLLVAERVWCSYLRWFAKKA